MSKKNEEILFNKQESRSLLGIIIERKKSGLGKNRGLTIHNREKSER